MKKIPPPNQRPSRAVRLHVLADRHLDFGPLSIPKPDADVVVLDGDVHEPQTGFDQSFVVEI